MGFVDRIYGFAQEVVEVMRRIGPIAYRPQAGLILSNIPKKKGPDNHIFR